MQRLHLDLTAGARGEMIAGSLVAVGATEAAATEVLRAAGLHDAELRVEEVRRAGLHAIRARVFVDGRELGPPEPVLADDGRHKRPERFDLERHRRPRPRPRMHEAAREVLAPATTAAAVEGGGPAFHRDRDVDKVRGTAKGAARAKSRAAKGPRLVEWLDGGHVDLRDLVEELKKSAVSPVAKALAARALRRATDALVAVTGGPALVEGPRAVRLYADVLANAALLEELSPAAVGATAVAVSVVASEAEGVVGGGAWPAPSPWLLEVLAGVPVHERDDEVPVSDVAGAAFAWACVPRFGARTVTTTTRQGFGADAVELPGRALGARALLGPPAPVRTRAGESQASPAFAVEGLLPADVDKKALAADLAALGARAPSLTDEVLLEDGAARVRLRTVLAPTVVDAAVRILWGAGAVDVATTWTELRSAGVANVTVPVGRGRTKAGVRVRVVTVDAGDGEVVSVVPDLDDVRAAARKQRASPHAVAAEAVATWERLNGSRSKMTKGSDGDEG